LRSLSSLLLIEHQRLVVLIVAQPVGVLPLPDPAASPMVAVAPWVLANVTLVMQLGRAGLEFSFHRFSSPAVPRQAVGDLG
jgi:hypothetical protein